MTNTTLIVKRHPDGYHYVPFDFDPSEERVAVVKGFYDALVAEGHELERVDGFNHHPPELADRSHPRDFHFKLVSGPRAAGG